MADFIPYVNTERDCRILARYYSDARYVRVSCENLPKTSKHLGQFPLWLDAGVDALDKWPNVNDNFKHYMAGWTAVDKIADPGFQLKPTASAVSVFVSDVLGVAAQLAPVLLSVPQLPVVFGNERNKINRQLAYASATWKAADKFAGKFVLPIVITHSSQIKLKAERTKRLELAKQCIEGSGAEFVWVADASLNDQDGSSTLESSKFPSLIAFHEELCQRLGDTSTIIAGPYWGFNLVLWCRGLIQHPAIGLGNAYQYHLPGGFAKQSKSRIALPSLRRWAIASSQLKGWLEDAVPKLSHNEHVSAEFAAILKHYPQISLDGRVQVAAFYKNWFSKIDAVPKPGRALAMYQDLSSAYVLGKGLPELPGDEGTARRPEKVSKQLMMFCL